MRKTLTLVFLAWWFLTWEPAGGGVIHKDDPPDQEKWVGNPKTHGPFESRGTCDGMRQWLYDYPGSRFRANDEWRKRYRPDLYPNNLVSRCREFYTHPRGQ